MNRAINGVMFVMISAILLAWAPTAAYAGGSPVTIITEDRKGIPGVNDLCISGNTVFFIDIRGKGEYSLDFGDPVPIPKGTGLIKVVFDFGIAEQIIQLHFLKPNGSPISIIAGSVAESIMIDANIANKIICGHNIPKGTTSLTLVIF